MGVSLSFFFSRTQKHKILDVLFWGSGLGNYFTKKMEQTSSLDVANLFSPTFPTNREFVLEMGLIQCFVGQPC